MDPRKWIPALPLFGSLPCVYCGGPADTSDHTPPRCFLPKTMDVMDSVMTVPACSQCNIGYSQDEMRTAAVVCTVSFGEVDRIAVAPGGWVHSAMQRDPTLHDFVSSRLGADGVFRPDGEVVEAIARVLTRSS